MTDKETTMTHRIKHLISRLRRPQPLGSREPRTLTTPQSAYPAGAIGGVGFPAGFRTTSRRHLKKLQAAIEREAGEQYTYAPIEPGDTVAAIVPKLQEA